MAKKRKPSVKPSPPSLEVEADLPLLGLGSIRRKSFVAAGFAFVDELFSSGHADAAIGDRFRQGDAGRIQETLNALARLGNIMQDRLAFHRELSPLHHFDTDEPSRDDLPPIWVNVRWIACHWAAQGRA